MSGRESQLEQLIPPTTLEFHILLTLGDGERHGYAIIKEIEQRTDGKLRPRSGTLYAAIQRLEDGKLIEEVSPARKQGDQRRRYYRITPRGKRVAQMEARRLSDLVSVARKKKLFPKAAR